MTSISNYLGRIFLTVWFSELHVSVCVSIYNCTRERERSRNCCLPHQTTDTPFHTDKVGLPQHELECIPYVWLSI